jgi:hypothetical protein
MVVGDADKSLDLFALDWYGGKFSDRGRELRLALFWGTAENPSARVWRPVLAFHSRVEHRLDIQDGCTIQRLQTARQYARGVDLPNRHSMQTDRVRAIR